MPIFSGGGGGSGPAAGSYLPVAGQAGLALDTTTYSNSVTGVGNYATLVGTGQRPFLAVAQSGDAFPRILFTDDVANFFFLGNGTFDPWATGIGLSFAGTTALQVNSELLVSPAGQTASAVQLQQVSPLNTIVGNPFPTASLSSGAGAQISTTRDVETVTPVTFNPTAGAAATCVVALSADGTNYTNLGTATVPAGVALDGTIHLIAVRVPATWKIKLTVTNATIGTTTWY